MQKELLMKIGIQLLFKKKKFFFPGIIFERVYLVEIICYKFYRFHSNAPGYSKGLFVFDAVSERDSDIPELTLSFPIDSAITQEPWFQYSHEQTRARAFIEDI